MPYLLFTVETLENECVLPVVILLPTNQPIQLISGMFVAILKYLCSLHIDIVQLFVSILM